MIGLITLYSAEWVWDSARRIMLAVRAPTDKKEKKKEAKMM